MDLHELRKQHKAALKLRDALILERANAPGKVKAAHQELQEMLDGKATAANLNEAGRGARAKLFAPHQRAVEEFVRGTTPLAALLSNPQDADEYDETMRDAVLLRPPTVSGKFYSDSDFIGSDGNRIVFAELRALREDLKKDSFYQRLSAAHPAAVARLATVEASRGAETDHDLLSACWHAVFAPGRPESDALKSARATMHAVRKTMTLPTEMEEEQRLLVETVKARQEILQSQQALLTGDESITTAEASRDIAEAEAAGIPDAGALVASERLTRQRGEKPPPRPMIPISHNPNPNPAA